MSSDEIKVWCFHLEGSDESEVHGQLLRKKIKHLADKNGISAGSVRNIKFKPLIEVKVVGTQKQAEDFCKYLRAGDKSGKKLRKLKQSGLVVSALDKPSNYSDFAIVREDELTEMVWALQGAGNSFRDSAKITKAILKKIEGRDELEAHGRLCSLLQEVLHVKENLENEIKRLERNEPVKTIEVRNSCLKEAMLWPPCPQDDIIQATIDMYYEFELIKEEEIRISQSTEEVNRGQRLIQLEKRLARVSDYVSQLKELLGKPVCPVKNINDKGITR